MPESLDAFAELRAMRARLEGIEHRQEILVRAHSDEILNKIWEYIDNDPLLGEVYLSIDGKRTQQGLIDALKEKGITTISQPTISRRLGKLMNELSLIEVVERTTEGASYRKTDLDKILHLTPKVERRLTALKKSAKKGSA
jgi:hypothetical protein